MKPNNPIPTGPILHNATTLLMIGEAKKEKEVTEDEMFCHLLNARVRLVIRMLARLPVVIPLPAPLVKLILVANGAGNLVLALEELHAEALTGVPCDMAMHDPGAWVISREGDEEIATRGKSCSVAASGIVEGEAVGGAVPDAGALADDVEVVAVQMDGMRQGNEGARLDPPEIPLKVCQLGACSMKSAALTLSLVGIS